MSNSNSIPPHFLHTAAHEWLEQHADGTCSIGITHAGQDMLGDIVFCGDAKLGARLQAGDTCAVVESVKAASDVHMPISGEVIAFNTAIEADPTVLNTAAYATWIVKIKPDSAPVDATLAGLMSAQAYTQQL